MSPQERWFKDHVRERPSKVSEQAIHAIPFEQVKTNELKGLPTTVLIYSYFPNESFSFRPRCPAKSVQATRPKKHRFSCGAHDSQNPRRVESNVVIQRGRSSVTIRPRLRSAFGTGSGDRRSVPRSEHRGRAPKVSAEVCTCSREKAVCMERTPSLM